MSRRSLAPPRSHTRRRRQVRWSVWPTLRAHRLTSPVQAQAQVPVPVQAEAQAPLQVSVQPQFLALRLALPPWLRPPRPHNRPPTLRAPLWPQEVLFYGSSSCLYASRIDCCVDQCKAATKSTSDARVLADSAARRGGQRDKLGA